MNDTPGSYHVCGSIEGDVEGIQRVNCHKPMSSRFVQIDSTYNHMYVHEIEVIGHGTHHNHCNVFFGFSSELICNIWTIAAVDK